MVRKFYKRNTTDKIWWIREGKYKNGEWYQAFGTFLFSFDKKKVFNLFGDYPHELSREEKEIFDKENPFWAEAFKDRSFEK